MDDSNSLKKGQKAPDFELGALDESDETMTKLSTLIAEKPVVLFFGSYT